jgi:hypothetical protein
MQAPFFIFLLLSATLFSTRANAEESFAHLWSGYATSLSGRSPQQRSNAVLAGRFIDNHIIPPAASSASTNWSEGAAAQRDTKPHHS